MSDDAGGVRVESLCVEREGRRVFGPLHLELAPGSWTRLVGPSGSGKTTLLRAIAGLVVPSEGRVFIDGRRMSDGKRLLVPPERRGIGFVFQGAGAALWPHLSVRATLAFVLARRGTPRGERARRSAELVALVGLEGFEARRPGELSGGEAQRLALARALVGRPSLLLLDEPLSALDVSLRARMVEVLAETHRRLAPTILHVTHDPREAFPHVTRGLALDGGGLRSIEGSCA